MTGDSGPGVERPDGPTRTTIIVGGGVSGLSAAWELLQHAAGSDRLIVLEATGQAGGIIRTERSDGFLIEHGPDSFITNKAAAAQLCDELGLGDALIPTRSENRQSLVVNRGRVIPVPAGFQLIGPTKWWPFLKSSVLSPRGRLRVLLEPMIPAKARDDVSDESLASFVRRRFGDEALKRIVQPLVGGIYTADPEKLSLNATLERFRRMEREYGCVTHGLREAARSQDDRPSSDAVTGDPTAISGARYGLFATLCDGLQMLTDRLVERLTADPRCDLRLHCGVAECEKTADGWKLRLKTDDAPLECDRLLIATSAPVAASLLRQADRTVAVSLAAIEHASSAVVALGYRSSDIAHPMDAFGLVVPSCENRRILAVSFSSRKFPGRAPDDCVLLRVFVGGAMQAALLDRDDSALTELVKDELLALLGAHGQPLLTRVTRYPQAMPQYYVGHLDRAAAIRDAVARIDGLELATNALGGVGLPDCVGNARDAAKRLLETAD